MDYYDDYTGDGAITMDDYGDSAAPEAEFPAYLRDVEGTCGTRLPPGAPTAYCPTTASRSAGSYGASPA